MIVLRSFRAFLPTLDGTGSRETERAASSGRPLPLSVSDDEEIAVVLGVDLPVAGERQRCVRGAERESQEDVLLQCSALIDRVEVAVFAVRVNDAVRVDRGRVDAPLE